MGNTMANPESPLTPAHLTEVAAARRRRRAITVAAGVAAFNGWSTAVCAGLSVVLLVFTWWALAAAILLGAIAAVELYGRRLLLRFDPGAPAILALNQLAFLGLITLYCLARMITGSGEIHAALMSTSELAQLGPDIEQLLRVLMFVTYTAVILGSLVFNGGCAIYYFTRRKPLAVYLAETPAWVRELERR